MIINTNRGIPYYPVREIKKYNYKALCFSEICMVMPEYTRNDGRKRKERRATMGEEKQVSRAHDFCPDCGHALYWERIEK